MRTTRRSSSAAGDLKIVKVENIIDSCVPECFSKRFSGCSPKLEVDRYVNEAVGVLRGPRLTRHVDVQILEVRLLERAIIALIGRSTENISQNRLYCVAKFI